mgnify:CR=1 FL=1
MMPSGPATHFAEMMLFSAAVLEHVGIEYVIHYGSLLGAARLGAPLPWDEDHDVFMLDVDIDDVWRRTEAIFDAHGYRLSRDWRGFIWVREKLWPAASGHVALDVLPPLGERVEDLPVWEGGAPHLVPAELRPLKRVPFYSTFIWGPAATETILARLYGESASEAAMAAFRAPPMTPEAAAFWARARTPERLDWEAISERFRNRSRWRHLLNVPWWWFNGGYIVAINALRRRARARLGE